MRRRPAPRNPRAGTRTVAGVLILLLVGGALAGCGGGDDDGERLSAAALTEAAEAVCAAGATEADRLRGEAQPGARGADAAKEIGATLEALDGQVRGFEDLRGPADTDDDLDALVRHLKAAAAGLEELRDAAVAGDLTIDETIAANPEVVQEVNRSSAQAADALVALGWLTCVGAGTG